MSRDSAVQAPKAPTSEHVNSRLYAKLDTLARDLENPALCEDLRCEGDIQRVIDAEARLLDAHQYSAWLELFTQDCIYWMPSAWPVPSSAGTIALEFHDRRRLLDRIARLGTQAAYSQIPRSRTSRVLGAAAVIHSDAAEDGVLVRCNFMLSEFRGEHLRTLAGYCGYWIRPEPGTGPRIALKLIHLLDCDHPQGNNSFFL